MNTQPPPEPGPAPAAASLRELRARGQKLKARLALGHKGLSDPFVQEVRAELARSELIKVRIEEEDRGEADRLAEELARRVPCHLVQRIGRVALLFLARSPSG